jgi:membrane protein
MRDGQSQLSGLARSAFRALWRLIHYLDLHEAPRAASAMAFDAFLSTIPLLAVTGWALHRLRDAVADMVASLLRAAPPSVSSALGEEFFRISDAKALVLAPLGLVAFLWVSSAGAATAIGVFETMFVCVPRPWWQRRLVGLALILGAVPGVAIATAIGIFVASVAGSLGGSIVAALAPLVIVTGMVAAFYRFAIRRPASVTRRIWPGAVVTVALWASVSTLFSVYVRSLARYATLYGNLANVAVLLFWFWLLSMALLVGGEVNAQLEGVRDPHDDTPEPWPVAPTKEPPAPRSEPEAKLQPAPVFRPKSTASSD